MVKCVCGWSGTKLIPDYLNNSAHCPICLAKFEGINADNAVVTRLREAQQEEDWKEKRDAEKHGGQ